MLFVMLVVFSLLAHDANFDPGQRQSLDGNANTILDDAIVYSVDQIGRKTKQYFVQIKL